MESGASESPHEQPEEEEEIIRSIHLSDDIILDILSRLPLKSLLRFKSVCKSWYHLLTHDPSFIMMHLNQSIKVRRYNLLTRARGRMYCVDCFPLQSADNPVFELDAAQIDYPLQSESFWPALIGQSCNGLFLIYGRILHRQTVALGFAQYTRVLYLWNPSTKEHKILPTIISEAPQHPEEHNCVFGLGYDSIKNDYKVIRIMQYCPSCNTEAKALNRLNPNKCTVHCKIETVVHCYSLQTNSCRRIQGIPDFVTDCLHYNLSKTGVFVKGAIHWWLQSRDLCRMVAFDVSSEEFKEVSMPDNMKINESTKFTFGALENNLCLYQQLAQDCRVDVFMMKVYGVKQSWTKFFSVDLDRELRYEYFRPLWVSNTEKHILLQHRFASKPTCYPILNIQRMRWSWHAQMDLPSSLNILMIEPWIESLVSLKQNTIVGNE